MGLRLPSMAEAEALADAFEAAGYPRDEAAANFRNAFPEGDPDGVDGCLIFEGDGMAIVEAVSEAWSGLDAAGRDEHGSWLNAVSWLALVTIAARAGETRAPAVAAADLDYIKTHWRD